MKLTKPCAVMFYGCLWDDHWEYEAPCALYRPFKRLGYGGNSYAIDAAVDRVCGELISGKDVATGWTAGDLKEREWRGWGKRFDRREAAQHVKIAVRFFVNADDGEWDYEPTSRIEKSGPFNRRKGLT